MSPLPQIVRGMIFEYRIDFSANNSAERGPTVARHRGPAVSWFDVARPCSHDIQARLQIVYRLFLRMNDSTTMLELTEQVVFFPTDGYSLDGAVWNIPIHGWVFNPKVDSKLRRVGLNILRRLMKLDKNDANSQLNRGRVRSLLVKNLVDRRFTIQIGNDQYQLPQSSPNGHFRASFQIAHESAMQNSELEGRRLSFQIGTDVDSAQAFGGDVWLIPQHGISVVSDIDDTIKISGVREMRELLANTFVREFRPVDGMAELYRHWQAQGAAFHYVSGSPWQLAQPLTDFIDRWEFPGGSLRLRHFRLKDRNALSFISKPDELKQTVIREKLLMYPHRDFVLVGDSGERDPEMYAQIALDFPGRIHHIAIRNVTDEGADSTRYRRTFEMLPSDLWTVFDNPDTLHGVVTEKT